MKGEGGNERGSVGGGIASPGPKSLHFNSIEGCCVVVKVHFYILYVEENLRAVARAALSGAGTVRLLMFAARLSLCVPAAPELLRSSLAAGIFILFLPAIALL